MGIEQAHQHRCSLVPEGACVQKGCMPQEINSGWSCMNTGCTLGPIDAMRGTFTSKGVAGMRPLSDIDCNRMGDLAALQSVVAAAVMRTMSGLGITLLLGWNHGVTKSEMSLQTVCPLLCTSILNGWTFLVHVDQCGDCKEERGCC